MGKSVRRAFFALGSLLLAAYFLFPFDLLLKRQFNNLREQLRRHRVILEAQVLEAHPPHRISFSGLGIQILNQNGIVPFLIDQGEVKLIPSISLLIRPTLALTGLCYQGQLNLQLNYGIYDSSLALSSSFANIHLESHPITRFLGLSGTLRGDIISEIDVKSRNTPNPKTITGTLTIERANIAQGSPLFQPLNLPQVTDIAARVQLNQQGRRFAFPKVLLTSSLGDLAGRGTISIDDDFNIVGIKADAKINLSEEGATTIGGFLALAYGQSVEPGLRKWKLVVSQRPGYQIELRVEPLRQDAKVH